MSQWPPPPRGPMPGSPPPMRGPWGPPFRAPGRRPVPPPGFRPAGRPLPGHYPYRPGPPGPPPGWAPPPPRPPRKSDSGLIILLVVVLVIGMFGALLVSGVGAVIDIASRPGTTTRPTWSDPPQPTDTTEPPTPEPTDTPGSTGSYRNEDYRVPPPDRDPGSGPSPRTYSQADDLLQRNSLYQQTMPVPVRCRPDGIDATRTTVQERGAYYTTMTECLMRAFAPLIRDAGYNMHRPTVTMYSEAIRTACGTMRDLVNGFYCSGDGQIYIGSRDYEGVEPEQQPHRQNVDFTIAHEFGHAIQDRTGILAAERAFEHRHKGTPLANTYSRRLEQQADCLTGLFTNAVAQARGIDDTERQFLGELVRNFGGPRGSTHGTPDSRQKWVLKGTNATSLSVCNTFIVPESEVE